MAYHLDDYELYFFNEGLSTAAYKALGCHTRVNPRGEQVYRFSVWAPEARAVSVVGDFNAWNPNADPMIPVGTTGVWEAFLGLCRPGQCYKYAIITKNGDTVYRADPYAVRGEFHGTASIVDELPAFSWTDAAFTEEYPRTFDRPVSIYEVHAGSWKKDATYRSLADELIDYVADMRYTHIEFMPLMEYSLDQSLGYHTTGYYAVSSRYGTPEDLMYFVNKAHERGLRVVMDWVPASFARDAHGLSFFDGSCCYEHFEPCRRNVPGWDTVLFNFSRNQVHSFLLSNAVYWLEEFHFDGLRVIGAAAMLYRDFRKQDGQWMPNRYGGREDTGAVAFFRKLSRTVMNLPHCKALTIVDHEGFPGVTNEVRDGGLGFTAKWNLNWMNDILSYMGTEPFFRKWNHDKLTYSLSQSMYDRQVLPLPHNEIMAGKNSLIARMPGEYAEKFAQLRLLFAAQFAYPGKKLMCMGDEFGQFSEWRYDRGLDWNLLGYQSHAGVQKLVRRLNKIYSRTPALYEADTGFHGFAWLQPDDSRHSVIAWARIGTEGDTVICVMNFGLSPWHGYNVGVADEGVYREILNTDLEKFGGSGLFRNGEVESVPVSLGRWENILSLNLAPFSAVFLQYEGKKERETDSGLFTE